MSTAMLMLQLGNEGSVSQEVDPCGTLPAGRPAGWLQGRQPASTVLLTRILAIGSEGRRRSSLQMQQNWTFRATSRLQLQSHLVSYTQTAWPLWFGFGCWFCFVFFGLRCFV